MHIVFAKNVKSKLGDPAQNLEFPHKLPFSLTTMLGFQQGLLKKWLYSPYISFVRTVI